MSATGNQPKDPIKQANNEKSKQGLKAIYPKVNGQSPDHLTPKSISQETSPIAREHNPAAPTRKINLAEKITLIIIATVGFLWFAYPYLYLLFWGLGWTK